MKDSLNNLTSLVTTLAQTIQALQKDQEKAAKDIAAKDKLYNELLAQNAELRGSITCCISRRKHNPLVWPAKTFQHGCIWQ